MKVAVVSAALLASSAIGAPVPYNTRRDGTCVHVQTGAQAQTIQQRETCVYVKTGAVAQTALPPPPPADQQTAAAPPSKRRISKGLLGGAALGVAGTALLGNPLSGLFGGSSSQGYRRDLEERAFEFPRFGFGKSGSGTTASPPAQGGGGGKLNKITNVAMLGSMAFPLVGAFSKPPPPPQGQQPPPQGQQPPHQRDLEERLVPGMDMFGSHQNPTNVNTNVGPATGAQAATGMGQLQQQQQPQGQQPHQRDLEERAFEFPRFGFGKSGSGTTASPPAQGGGGGKLNKITNVAMLGSMAFPLVGAFSKPPPPPQGQQPPPQGQQPPHQRDLEERLVPGMDMFGSHQNPTNVNTNVGPATGAHAATGMSQLQQQQQQQPQGQQPPQQRDLEERGIGDMLGMASMASMFMPMGGSGAPAGGTRVNTNVGPKTGASAATARRDLDERQLPGMDIFGSQQAPTYVDTNVGPTTGASASTGRRGLERRLAPLAAVPEVGDLAMMGMGGFGGSGGSGSGSTHVTTNVGPKTGASTATGRRDLEERLVPGMDMFGSHENPTNVNTNVGPTTGAHAATGMSQLQQQQQPQQQQGQRRALEIEYLRSLFDDSDYDDLY